MFRKPPRPSACVTPHIFRNCLSCGRWSKKREEQMRETNTGLLNEPKFRARTCLTASYSHSKRLTAGSATPPDHILPQRRFDEVFREDEKRIVLENIVILKSMDTVIVAVRNNDGQRRAVLKYLPPKLLRLSELLLCDLAGESPGSDVPMVPGGARSVVERPIPLSPLPRGPRDGVIGPDLFPSGGCASVSFKFYLVVCDGYVSAFGAIPYNCSSGFVECDRFCSVVGTLTRRQYATKVVRLGKCRGWEY